jgi:hypothetical protein
LRARTWRQRDNGTDNRQSEKLATLHHILLNDHVRGDARSCDARDDGGALKRCRVLRENSNDGTAGPARDDAFIAGTRFTTTHFS